MKIDHVDIFFLHSNICADDYVYANRPDLQNSYATRWTIYAEHVIPAMEKLKAAGKIASWGITGSGVPDAILRALRHSPAPGYVQAVTNLLDSAGSLRRYADPARPREIIAAASERGVERARHSRGAGGRADGRSRSRVHRRTIPTARTMNVPRRSARSARRSE